MGRMAGGVLYMCIARLRNTKQKEEQMKRNSITLVAVCLCASHLVGQSTGVGGSYRNAYESGPVLPRAMLGGRNIGVRQNLDGSVCFPAPFYPNCIYDLSPYALEVYRYGTFYAAGSGMDGSDLRQPGYTDQPQEPPPPPPPPVTPILHEYNWPGQGSTSATFSIVTTSGTLHLATMVWVEGENLHFNAVEGGVRQIPLSAVSRSLTQTANARKSLTLPLPSTGTVGASAATAN